MQAVTLDAGEITINHVSCAFRHRSGVVAQALNDVSLVIPAGQFVCVVGRSGHGKTTLLRVLAGLQRPTSGATYVGGKQVVGPSSDRGMVFQQDTVFPWMHVRA